MGVRDTVAQCRVVMESDAVAVVVVTGPGDVLGWYLETYFFLMGEGEDYYWNFQKVNFCCSHDGREDFLW